MKTAFESLLISTLSTLYINLFCLFCVEIIVRVYNHTVFVTKENTTLGRV